MNIWPTWYVLKYMYTIELISVKKKKKIKKGELQVRGSNTHFRSSAEGICNHLNLLKSSQ